MPSVSQKQRGLIFGKRSKYGSKEKTPKKWKWIWEEGWENKGKLPKKKKKNKMKNENVKYFSDFVLNEGNDQWQNIIDFSYNAWLETKKRNDGMGTEAFANQIKLTAIGFINNKGSELSNWLDKFKDEELVLKELESIK